MSGVILASRFLIGISVHLLEGCFEERSNDQMRDDGIRSWVFSEYVTGRWDVKVVVLGFQKVVSAELQSIFIACLC